jgi:hypothetical protein
MIGNQSSSSFIETLRQKFCFKNTKGRVKMFVLGVIVVLYVVKIVSGSTISLSHGRFNLSAIFG